MGKGWGGGGKFICLGGEDSPATIPLLTAFPTSGFDHLDHLDQPSTPNGHVFSWDNASV